MTLLLSELDQVSATCWRCSVPRCHRSQTASPALTYWVSQIDDAREKGLDELLRSIRHAFGSDQIREAEVVTEMLESKLASIQVRLANQLPRHRVYKSACPSTFH